MKRNKPNVLGIRQLLPKFPYLDTKLVERINKFSDMQGNLEHPKNQMEVFFADWEFASTLNPDLRSKSIDKPKEGVLFDVEATAQNGLLLYYQMCEQIYSQLTKSTT